ncbi:hypothetical protein EXS70_01640 [Candidatus Peribacteria bacterium]|nr:hypothetical protein [Candidatus Peribacteria bacterium]
MFNTKIDISISVLVTMLLVPFSGWTAGTAPSAAATKALFDAGKPFEQDLVMTAYYSPLPDQCCYVKGSYMADVELNGEGHHGADGTAVYPGMVAAPPSYPFGTRLVLPGIGTVTVHDRGGAIQEWQDAHRLDIWVGSGEEGLARALEFGVQRVRATVYPRESLEPAESLDITRLPAPPEQLHRFLAASMTLFDISAKADDHTASVTYLQQKLVELKYLQAKPNGTFGSATQKALEKFYGDMGITDAPDRLTEAGAAALEAALRRVTAKAPIAAIVSKESAPVSIFAAQRTLRFLGFYKGRTNGRYDQSFTDAVLAFQKKNGIVISDSEPGAGRIGPKTHAVIVSLWKQKHVRLAATRLLALRKLDQVLAKRGYTLSQYLGKGDHGEDVRTLQKFLITRGYLKDSVTGTFGAKTQTALIAYQKDAGIIASTKDAGAGFAGPATLAKYRQDVRQSLLKVVRAKGWEAI